jgi:hypothetical protein
MSSEPPVTDLPFRDPALPLAQRVDDLISRLTLDEHIGLLYQYSPGVPRLGLLFRDWFRGHPEAVPGYGRFKRVVAQTVSDPDAYSDIKDPVVDLLVELAGSWAARRLAALAGVLTEPASPDEPD